MRVMMLSWEYPPISVGGLARHVQDLSEALVEQGEEVHVITQGEQQKTEILKGVHVHRVETYPLDPPDFLTWVMQLNIRFLEEGSKLLQQKKFNIVHAHDWLSAFCGRGLKHAFKLPLVATIHATESGRNQGLHNGLQEYIHSVEWWLAYEAWNLIVCSKHMFYEVQRLFNLPSDKIHIIPNGVNIRNFKLKENQRFSRYNPNDKLILYVGRLVREKGIQVLLHAAPRILAEFPQARFVIAGKGPMEGELKHITNVLGIGHRVHFAGYVDDDTRNELYQQAAAAAFPSLYEPFGIVALEAMATRTPVIVSDTGGFHEIVEHGVTGMKAYPGNTQSLADNILAVFRDRDLSQKLSDNGYRLVINKYSWDHIAELTRDLYNHVWREYRGSDWVRDRGLLKQARKLANQSGNYRPEAEPGRYTLVDRRLKAVNLEEKEGAW